MTHNDIVLGYQYPSAILHYHIDHICWSKFPWLIMKLNNPINNIKFIILFTWSFEGHGLVSLSPLLLFFLDFPRVQERVRLWYFSFLIVTAPPSGIQNYLCTYPSTCWRIQQMFSFPSSHTCALGIGGWRLLAAPTTSQRYYIRETRMFSKIGNIPSPFENYPRGTHSRM